MSEEEKKAIEELKDISNYCNGMNCDLEDYDSYDFNRDELDKLSIVLNLIEKQAKEIENLRKYISYAPNLDEITASKYNAIQQEGYIKGIVEAQERAKQIINEECIPKQKIKELIEIDNMDGIYF